MNYVVFALLGLFAGFTSALLGIGGGVVMVPAILFICGASGITMEDATVTSLAYIVPVALAGMLFKWHSGDHIRWALVLLAAPAGILGAHLGRVAEHHVNAAQLKVLFALLMVLVAVKLGMRGIREMRTGGPPAVPGGATQHGPNGT